MKLTLIALIFLASCSHLNRANYRPVIQFKEDEKLFSAEINLPKKFNKRLPLIVVVHEWWGRNSFVKEQAQKLTKAGYATMVVDLYGNFTLAQTPDEAKALATPFYQSPSMGTQRLAEYISRAKDDPHVDAKQIYVIGFCFGGTQALNLARVGAEVAGVVSFHGGLSSTLPRIPIKARILALNGLADPIVPELDRKNFDAEMKELKADYLMVNYEGATHAFTNPQATEIGKKFNLPVAYHPEAAQAAWDELLKFLPQAQ